MGEIFNEELLSHGPWQEFERNTARLLLHAGWRDARIVGRSSDGGADVLAVNSTDANIWVFQCKFSSRTGPGIEAIEEVRRAGRLYKADTLCVVSSKPPTNLFSRELDRVRAQGLPMHHLGPQDLLTITGKLPIHAPSRFVLRDYQSDALDRLRSAILDTGRGQLVLATGLGKTVVIAELVADMLNDGLLGEGRILVLSHTVPLINQLYRRIFQRTDSRKENALTIGME